MFKIKFKDEDFAREYDANWEIWMNHQGWYLRKLGEPREYTWKHEQVEVFQYNYPRS
jgi:hypothetical protein